ncbi:FAD/NAD(P)-binding protein [Paracoccus laeviglucosivorans]|uniref:Uncharacterized NAD(P)/FAD-binding protein YdhS n=1 Tax=Paracoccus laeviglucosivorans TaxID=1197861 RepID=A0A521B3A1_9RHOB|nr:FAD-dependent oxidoreductase [Paracoccus laeviglucosivorans]SMO41587.1 Uncharacterized NAD(P)/FAD-binding protein YdhS [Paracoccus laeviglucosivorans]
MNQMPTPPLAARLRVVVIGGGVSGATVAWQLARMQVPASVTVVEPRAELGRGLAYSTNEPTHRINVPAHRMTIDPDNRADFVEWLAKAEATGKIKPDTDAPTASGDVFPRREVFGAYVADRLSPYLQSGAVRHIRARVSDIERLADGTLLLILSDESRIRADQLVLATGHPAPALPKVIAGLAGSRHLVADPYDPALLAGIDPHDRVLIMGAALTSADVIATLERQGFAGQITCISRHGLRSRGHGMVTQDCQVDFTQPPAGKVSDLLCRVRRAIAEDQARGQTWHAVLHRLRAQGQQIWTALDGDAQARLLRHLRTFWDVHRYRIAPQLEAVQIRLIETGHLDYVAGHLVLAIPRDGAVEVTWRVRGSESLRQRSFDRIIVTTGPAHGRCIDANPALAALARMGLISPDPLGMGIATVADCVALDAQGHESDRVLVAGPLARGHVGELVGAPECAAHACNLARDIAARCVGAVSLRALSDNISDHA